MRKESLPDVKSWTVKNTLEDKKSLAEMECGEQNQKTKVSNSILF